MPAPDESSSHRLDYGQPQRRHLPRRHHRWIIVAALALLIYFGWSSFQSLLPHLKLWYWEDQCLAHPIPPGIVVYNSGPPRVCILSPEWSGLFDAGAYRYFFWPQTNNATVYFGQRQATNGLRRFISADAYVIWTPDKKAVVNIFTAVLPMGIHSEGAKTLAPPGGIDFGWGIGVPTPPQPEVIIHSAVEDPNDPSHFWFAYDVFINHHIVNCWLQPDGTLKTTVTESGRGLPWQGNAPKTRRTHPSTN